MKEPIKVRDGNKWVEVDPSTFKEGPIIHVSLPDSLLTRIGIAYEMLREVITYNGNRLSLEQFEVMFMREVSPTETVKVFEAMGFAYCRAKAHFPDDQYTHEQIYHWLVLLIMGGVTDEDMKKEEVKIIRHYFAAVYPPLRAAA